MRRALEIRDQHRCAFPSCTHTRFLDAHHFEHWVDGGATELDNLFMLCRRHHTFVHEHGYRIERTAQGTQFIAPARRSIPTQPPQNWDGARADHEWIVGVMCQQTFGVQTGPEGNDRSRSPRCNLDAHRFPRHLNPSFGD